MARTRAELVKSTQAALTALQVPRTAVELAEIMDWTPRYVRRFMADLQDSGTKVLITEHNRPGRGRPQHRFQVPTKARKSPAAPASSPQQRRADRALTALQAQLDSAAVLAETLRTRSTELRSYARRTRTDARRLSELLAEAQEALQIACGAAGQNGQALGPAPVDKKELKGPKKRPARAHPRVKVRLGARVSEEALEDWLSEEHPEVGWRVIRWVGKGHEPRLLLCGQESAARTRYRKEAGRMRRGLVALASMSGSVIDMHYGAQ